MDVGVFMGLLFDGFGFTVGIFFITLIGSLPLGILVALARMSKIKPLSFIMGIYMPFRIAGTSYAKISSCFDMLY